jgi:formate--tetrahydrofolate ligase
VGYGGSIVMSYKAQQQLTALKKHGFDNMAVCFAKTPMSITTDGSVKGAPKGFDVPIRELKLCAGAGFIYALSGSVMTMPGLPDKPAFMNLDIDEDGNIVGLS